MTTNSVAYYGRQAIQELAKTNPEIKIKSIKGGRFGNSRVAKVTFENEKYLQFVLPALGTHSFLITQTIVLRIKASCKDL